MSFPVQKHLPAHTVQTSAFIVLERHVGLVLGQQRHHVVVAQLSGQHGRRAAALVLGVGIRSLCQEEADQLCEESGMETVRDGDSQRTGAK